MTMPEITLHLGDCLEILPGLADASVDAVITDPPAGISFMGKDWDHHKGGRREWIAWLSSVLVECLRVAKPGSILLCWALPRTSHWTGTAIEDAGWIIEDRIAHVQGQGFPKHKSKLKPATEDWWLARKSGGAKWLGVDGCRVAAPEGLTTGGRNVGSSPNPMNRAAGLSEDRNRSEEHPAGRWPANLLMTHSPLCNGTCDESCPIRLMGEQGGTLRSGKAGKNGHRRSATLHDTEAGWHMRHDESAGELYGDSGSAARFFPNFDADPLFYCPKASRKDRGDGNTHPTCKSTKLMAWLCRLACPPGGTVLDPFMGSGSTGLAATEEGFGFIGIEQSPEYHEIATRRLQSARAEAPLFAGMNP